MLESLPLVRSALFAVRHPIHTSVSVEKGYTRDALFLVPRLVLAGWINLESGEGQKPSTIALSNLKPAHKSEILLEIAGLLLSSQRALPDGKVPITIYGIYDESADLSSNAIVTGFKIEGSDIVNFATPLLFARRGV